MTFHIEIKNMVYAGIMVLLAIGAVGAPAIATSAEYTVVIENHVFVPEVIEMTAGEKHRLTVLNHDVTPEEFESYELNREKIVAGKGKIVIFLPALDIGEYPFFGEFNPDTAQGRIVVK
ncbi:MAG: cupredoxin domain-containing protein [Mariprofundus sp.]|nr:cupredoxin domain-containing protein [Mariprofundus sp.]